MAAHGAGWKCKGQVEITNPTVRGSQRGLGVGDEGAILGLMRGEFEAERAGHIWTVGGAISSSCC